MRTNAFVRFDSDNKIRYGQDFRFWQGLPVDVQFYPVEETENGYIVFIAEGYGIRPVHKIAGTYGNGPVFVVKDDIPDLVDWCRANFLQLGYTRKFDRSLTTKNN